MFIYIKTKFKKGLGLSTKFVYCILGPLLKKKNRDLGRTVLFGSYDGYPNWAIFHAWKPINPCSSKDPRPIDLKSWILAKHELMK